MSSSQTNRPTGQRPPDTPSGIMRIPAALSAVAARTLFDPVGRESEAESITVRIRWFGLCIGYLYVNLVGRVTGRIELNAMLTLGAIYAMLDTIASRNGKVLLSNYRLGVSVMEALFIGLLAILTQALRARSVFTTSCRSSSARFAIHNR